MKRTLSAMSLSAIGLTAVLAAGCGSNDSDFVVNSGNNGSSGSMMRASVPVAGGDIELPLSSGFSGRLHFDPGSLQDNQILYSTSTQPPATLPLTGLVSPDVTTTPFFYLNFSVTKPTPIELLEGVYLRGPIRDGAEHYQAEIFELSSDDSLHRDTTSQLLQVVPGESVDGTATFDETDDSTDLLPGHTYAMRFNSIEQKTLTLKIANDSGVSPMYVFITGQNPDPTVGDNRFYWVNPKGQLAPMDIDDLKDGFADYSYPLPADGALQLPLMRAGRVYISLGQKMKTQLNPPLRESDPPAFWVAPDGWSDAAKPNYKTLFDWVEFDYAISPDSKLPGMGINKTEVQMVGLPFTISMTGPTSGTETVGARPGARKALLDAMMADPNFKQLVVQETATGTEISPTRVISPDNGINNVLTGHPNVGTFPLDYYDGYIDEVWVKYKSEDLTLETSAFGTYIGRVNDQDQLVFHKDGERDIVIPKPSSSDVIIGHGDLEFSKADAPTQRDKDIVGEAASCLSACFNRSTLLVVPKLQRTYRPNSFDPALFYQAAITNLYSKAIHADSLPTDKAPLGAAYGFGFDDNLDQSSFIGDNRAPTEVRITVTKFD